MCGRICTDFFRCDCCHIDCRIDSEASGPFDSIRTAPLTIRHCPDSKGVAVLGKVTRFQERRGARWVDVQRWIDAA
jgi:hypothetical protein